MNIFQIYLSNYSVLYLLNKFVVPKSLALLHTFNPIHTAQIQIH